MDITTLAAAKTYTNNRIEEIINRGDASVVDPTLSLLGAAADAKITGDRLSLLENYVTPQMFGAIADGVTDDTDAVQTALNKGGIVYFPAGVYKVTRQLTTTKPCVIKMFKPYPSRFWRSQTTSGQCDYPIIIADGESDYETEKGWDFGARIDCYPSEGEKYGLLIGDGCEVDGLFMRAMNGFNGVLLKYDNAHEYTKNNIDVSVTYASYPSAARFKHIRLDCDRHNTETTKPESMFDFYPKNNYFYIIDDVVIGHRNEFATYGFRSVIDPEVDRWANSVRISNLCIDNLCDYPFFINEANTTYSFTNWIIEGLTIQTYDYAFNDYELTLDGHKSIITLKNMNHLTFIGCHIYDLYRAKYEKMFDCENLRDVSCIGCSDEFYGDNGIETFLRDKLQETAENTYVKSLEMSNSVLENDFTRITLKDPYDNEVYTDLPPISLSTEEMGVAVDSWMDKNASPREETGKNKLNIESSENQNGLLHLDTGICHTEVNFKNYFTSHFISANYEDKIRMSLRNPSSPEVNYLVQMYRMCMYDEEKNFLSSVAYTDESVIDYVMTVTDVNAAYIRISIVMTTNLTGGSEMTFDQFHTINPMVTVNDTDITNYEPYTVNLVGGLSSYFKIQSPNGTRYSVGVTDDGVIVGKDDEGNITGSTIPVKTSQLENDSGFITEKDILEISNVPTKVSQLENDKGYLTDDKFTTQAENEEPTYDEELASAEGWTTDGWSGDFANGFTHTTGNTNSLIFIMPEDTAQNTYRISFRCSEKITVESLMAKCGGSDLFDLYGQPYDPITIGIVSVENGNLEFVPASTFKGTITDISIKRVTGFNATKQIITDSTGEISCEMRTTKASLDNVFIGKHSGEDNISGVGCIAVGSSALKSNTSGFWNVGVGLNALRDNTVGSRNVGIGYIALAENITGTRNIAIGSYALNHNKTGNKNIAIGADCLDKNESGSENVAIGLQALYWNVSGTKNTAVGTQALTSSTGNNNTAIGYGALQKCTTGNANTAMGYCAGYGITTGSNNFALGANSLYKLKTGSNNIGIGVQAGRGQGTTAGFKQCIFIGNETGYNLCDNADYNILIGTNAGKAITTGSRNIIIGENLETPTPTTSYWVNIGDLYEGSRNTSDKYAKINGGLQLSDIPTTDPSIDGRVWNDNGVLRVSNSNLNSSNLITLPEVTEADNGKIFMVVNGKWQAVNVEGLTVVTENEEETPLSETY